MRAIATSSSSAAICAMAVSTPWPNSTRPVKIVTLPGAGKATQRSRLGLSLSGPGSGAFMTRAPRMTAAAFSTARMMRLCEPQRQILPSSASAICARVGCGLRSSNALAEIRMPDRQ